MLERVASAYIDRQLELVRRRRDEIAALESELAAKRRRVLRRLRELGEVGTPPPAHACRHRCAPAARRPDSSAMAATPETAPTPEHERLEEARTGKAPWKAWGPYLSERQWGTVREDYSQGGDAWDYFSHDQARSRAYRWGEDGIAGICDERQRLCLALALWNGADPILKERMFGLTNSQGNHGEDVKEYWFYLDSTPTHSYLKCQYKYPQRAFPYEDLVATNARRGKQEMEYELLDTGDLRRGPLLRRGRRVRQGRPRRHPDAGHRAQPRPGCGVAAPAPDALVSQHVVVGRTAPRSPP